MNKTTRKPTLAQAEQLDAENLAFLSCYWDLKEIYDILGSLPANGATELTPKMRANIHVAFETASEAIKTHKTVFEKASRRAPAVKYDLDDEVQS